MLQQTPVARVRDPWLAWMSRWPTPAALAAEPPGEAVRAWGRLGYPRRALRLHQAAVVIVERHGGEVPCDHAALLALPGVGSYTAAADRQLRVRPAARRARHQRPTGPHPGRDRAEFPASATTAAETALAEQFLPARADRAAAWAVASMELGAAGLHRPLPALRPDCPIRRRCAWHAAGRPAHDGTAAAGADRTRARTGSAAAPCSPCSGARVKPPRSICCPPGPIRPQRDPRYRVAGQPTAWSSGATPGFACQVPCRPAGDGPAPRSSAADGLLR